MENLQVGTVVSHFRYGEGVICRVNLTNYEIIFERGGKLQISKSNSDLEVVSEVASEGNNAKSGLNLNELEELVTYVLEKYNGITHKLELGSKWTGGMMTLQPANKELKPKEIPVEAFFHKIVMLRDRLRVLEQQLNSHPKLTDEEKIHMQQYITRSYGSLTTFNVLFANKEDYFVGQKGDE